MTHLVFKNRDTGFIERHDVVWYRDFLDDHVGRGGLQIGRHLERIADRPVFVVAATGVGKTVGVPIHLLLWLLKRSSPRRRAPSPGPCVLVVEPTIPICRSEADHMNRSFQAFLAERGLPPNAHPFGAVTGTYKSNVEAPIRFVTTGVFERMAERIDPERCRVVVDEAHRIVAQ
jgi:superfamily II DNA or RNA helicase